MSLDLKDKKFGRRDSINSQRSNKSVGSVKSVKSIGSTKKNPWSSNKKKQVVKKSGSKGNSASKMNSSFNSNFSLS